MKFLFRKGIASRWLKKGHMWMELRNGFSTKKETERAIQTRISKVDRAQIAFPLTTNGKSQHPYGSCQLLWCCQIDIQVKAWHGIANHPRPRCTIRKARARLLMKPVINLISWNTGSLHTSKPCLTCILQLAKWKKYLPYFASLWKSKLGTCA